MGISKEQIIDSSINILNRDGFEGLTMRALAKEFNVKAASLYWHIKNKQDLLDLLAEKICEPITVEEHIQDARQSVYSFCEQYRVCLLNVRDSVNILTASMPLTSHRLGLIQYSIKLMQALGVSEENIYPAVNMLNSYVLAFTDDEARLKQVDIAIVSTVISNMGMIFTDIDRQFKYGIDVLLAGFCSMENSDFATRAEV